MEYKISAEVRDFIVNFFTNTKGLPISFLEVNNLLGQIKPIVDSKEPAKPADTKVKEPEKKSG